MKANKNVELQLLGLKHRDELYSLVEANRTHLRKWLPWLDANRTSADTESFIKSAISQHEAGKGPHYAVFDGMVMCGVCGFNPVDVTNKVGGIGYWLSRASTGKGTMTLSVKALVEAGFQEYGLNRIEIACAIENTRSRAIPERLGFKLEGVLREREHLYNQYVDHAIYSMLASEFSVANRSRSGWTSIRK